MAGGNIQLSTFNAERSRRRTKIQPPTAGKFIEEEEEQEDEEDWGWVMTRTGKIARLPKPVRDQLNRQLADGVPGVRLVEWLNSLPETQQLLTEHFDGREINEPNLSEWKTGGYLDWEAQQDLLASVQTLAEEGIDLQAVTDGKLAEHLSTAVAGRYAQFLNHWNGEVDEGFLKKLKGLRMLCQDVAVLRRGELRAKALELKEIYYEDSRRDEEVKALDVCLEDAKEYPEVQASYEKVFALHRAYIKGKKQNWKYEQKIRQRKRVKEERQRVKEEQRKQLKLQKERLRMEKKQQKMRDQQAKREAKRVRWEAAHPGKDPVAGKWWAWRERRSLRTATMEGQGVGQMANNE